MERRPSIDLATPPLTREPLSLDPKEWCSIYIPFIHHELGYSNNLETISRLFEEHLVIGKVSRVDFTNAGSSGRGLSAYVHFEHWYNNASAIAIRKTIAEKEQFICSGFQDEFGFLPFVNNRFMVFRANRNPIPAITPELNMHQLIAANAALERRVGELEAEKENLEYLYEEAHKSISHLMAKLRLQSANAKNAALSTGNPGKL
jgi:hypothetical protein